MSAIPPGLPPTPPPQTPALAPAPVTAPAPPPTAATTTATPVSTVPAPIASLPVNATIEATVVASGQALAQARAVVQLMTALGNVTVRLPMPVPANAALKLLVVAAGANPQLRVISVNGQVLPSGPVAAPGESPPPSPPPLAGPLSGAPPSTGGASSLGPQAQAGAANGAGALADGLPSATAGIAATVVFGTEPGLPTGTQLTLRLLDLAPPEAPEFLPPAASEPDAVPPGPLPGNPPTAGPLASGTPPLPGERLPPAPGDELASATVFNSGSGPAAQPVGGSPSLGGTSAIGLSTSAPTGLTGAGLTAAVPTPAAAAPGLPILPATLSGVVAPNSLGGKPLVQTAMGLLSLDAAPDFPPGARLLLQTVGPPVPPATAAANTAPPPSTAASGWTAFGDAMAVLQQADPAAAQTLVQRLPDLGPQFIPNMVAWVVAAQTGEARAWLGERTVKALEKAGRADLIEQLAGDMADMRGAVSVPQSGNQWQALTLPLFFGPSIERVRLTVRRSGGDDDEKEAREEEGLRFLLDVEMSRLGPLQLDGLVKRNAKRFDLIVRSRLALPDEVRRDIGAIFARSLEGLGMTGGAVFKQTVAFIEPIPLDRDHAGLTI